MTLPHHNPLSSQDFVVFVSMKKLLQIVATGWLITLTGCVAVIDEQKDLENPTAQELQIPAHFDYSTTREQTVTIFALNNSRAPLPGVVFNLTTLNPDSTFQSLGKVATQADGKATTGLSLPAYQQALWVTTDYPGLPDAQKVYWNQHNAEVVFGGSEPERKSSTALPRPLRKNTSPFTFLAPYNSLGVPSNLEPVNDFIPKDLLDLVARSLPENSPVPTANPQYLADDIATDTQLKDFADVWVTFVHEGAGWRNALGYYVYDLNNPPATREDIKELFIIFPNASYHNSGGGLYSGNKVHLGRFAPNTGIGWFLVPNGWNGSTVAWKNDIKLLQ
jgi:hypothetical protein